MHAQVKAGVPMAEQLITYITSVEPDLVVMGTPESFGPAGGAGDGGGGGNAAGSGAAAAPVSGSGTSAGGKRASDSGSPGAAGGRPLGGCAGGVLPTSSLAVSLIKGLAAPLLLVKGDAHNAAIQWESE